jgi:parvulin-like peptidyl-prolyl isomerase
VEPCEEDGHRPGAYLPTATSATIATAYRILGRDIRQWVQQNEVVNKIATTEEEARAYYDSHLQEFTTPASVSLREILIASLVDPKGINVAADEAAKARADAVRGRVLAGESFEQVAAEASDSASRSNAGLIGPIKLDDLSADLRKMIDAMKPGDVSEPLRTTRGCQILKLESAAPTEVVPFDQARARIAEGVLTGKRQLEFLKYLERLRAQAIIEWKNADIKSAYDEGLKQRAAAAEPSR